MVACSQQGESAGGQNAPVQSVEAFGHRIICYCLCWCILVNVWPGRHFIITTLCTRAECSCCDNSVHACRDSRDVWQSAGVG